MAKMLVTRLRETDEFPCKQQATQEAPESRVTPETLTIGQLIRALTVGQLWKIIAAIVTALAAVATVAYKIGSGAW